MSLEDPFFVVRGEVQKAVNTARGLYTRWCQLLEVKHVSKEELDWTTNELRNSLRSIEWDLEDLEETICIVESNPLKFKIEPCEVAARRSFVMEMRESVKEMREHMSSPTAQTFLKKNKESLMGSREGYHTEELLTASSHTLEEQQLHQKLIIEEQDEQLELVSGSIRMLKHMSGRVGDELDEQTIMLEDFAHEMDKTHSHMDEVLKKMPRVSHMSGGTHGKCCGFWTSCM
ncbi:syntaxin-10 isoform X2 [Anolis carolinensis]|uniref:syntaxin-10 isoform X2 n=1 Tax=Anolis carolinensis TaxID=28377 RepID=UPI0007DB83F2|nr:PREDICTED: syntaxin-10 isoform X2 [Anolis carolinensis]|eukprot:XP_016851641.1 PREDICTED: syntaxin-10 isoform X2 [Anolis carolinensis]